MTWILIAIAAVFVVRHLWKSYNHPTNVLTRQAANMNWIYAGRVESNTGGHDTLLSRGRYTVQMQWRDGVPVMVTPPVQKPFADFIEIERWIAKTEAADEDAQAYTFDAEDAQEDEYAEKVMAVVKRQDEMGIEDLYATVLAMGAANSAYLVASSSLIHTGYKMEVDPFLIGMMHVTAIANALEEGKKLDAYSVAYLGSVEQNLLSGRFDPHSSDAGYSPGA